MAESNSFYVNGYRFESEKDTEEARLELRKINFFSEKLAGRNARSMLAVYDKLLDEKIFSTPVGWEYLRNLQMELSQSGIDDNLIRPIPLYHNFSHKEEKAENVTFVKQRIKPAQRENDKRKKQFKMSVMLNILLGIMVIAMFAITINSNNPNILNYKQALENRYASWEQELSDREEIVRQKEAKLNIK